MLHRILIAPDKFKDCMSARDVAQHLSKGIRKVISEVEIRILPMADGGEGTVEALVEATSGEIRRVRVHDPLMRMRDAFYGILGDGSTAVIEMAAASGIEMLKEGEKDPSATTTYGTGELIRHALDEGVTKVIIGIGGSATNDGGIGMAAALGARFLDKDGKEAGKSGKDLKDIERIDLGGLHERVKEVRFEVACDVDNPFYGSEGAALIYAVQKGADEKMARELDEGLEHLAELVQQQLNKDISDLPGAGAAGGLGGGLAAFLNAQLRPGMEIIREVTGLEEAVQWSDLVITGEGKTDRQTRYGKTPAGVTKTAVKYGRPVVLVSGALEEGYEELYKIGVDVILPLPEKPVSLEQALENAGTYLENAGERLMRMLLLNCKLL